MSATITGRRSAPAADVDRPGSHRQHEVLRLLPGPLLVIILVFLGALVLIPVLAARTRSPRLGLQRAVLLTLAFNVLYMLAVLVIYPRLAFRS